MSAPPGQIHDSAQRLCRQLAPNSTPRYVDLRPSPEIQVNDCFGGLPGYVRRHGGRQLTGWAIWEWPQVFIEAEFHSVWEAPDGTCVDVTPKQIPFKRVLFLPDPDRVYEGFQVDNVRYALRPDPEIARFIELSELMYREMNKGDLKHRHGEVPASPLYIRCFNEKAELEMVIAERYGHHLMAAIQAET